MRNADERTNQNVKIKVIEETTSDSIIKVGDVEIESKVNEIIE